MKYSRDNPPLVCMQTQSTCYRQTRTMTVRGVLWHSTGANNPNLKRYVQPSDNDPQRARLLELLGTNSNRNDWNHIEHQAGLNAWIGKLADGTVTAVQTMPWNYRPWGCGSGKKGSCNNGWIQFEICEDSLTDRSYFQTVYREAVELTAYLCRLYGLDPYGKVPFCGIMVPVILCHADSATFGVGSNHGDVYHWFRNFGVDMTNVRADVARTMKEEDDLTEAQVREIVKEELAGLLRAQENTPVQSWETAELEEAVRKGITDGARPHAFATRSEAAIMAKRAAGG